MEKKFTEINSVGEFGLIGIITKDFKNQNKSTVLGIGDDAALIDVGHKYMVVSTDMLLENIHFDLTYFPLQHLGYKAISVNISDILAMNAIPEQITVNIGISNKFSVEAIETLYKGIKTACDEYKVDLIGGDTTSSRSGLIISVTAIGSCEKNKVVKRSGAKPNDIICVTGDFGAAFLGLKLLSIEKKIFEENPQIQPEFNNAYLLKRFITPHARTEIIKKLENDSVIPTSMIDVSDGLASEILHISKMSQVGVTIFEDKIPIHNETAKVAEELQINPLVSALNGGEDYELLFTISQKNFNKIKHYSDVSFIGYINDKDKGNYLLTKSGQYLELEAHGWKHFE